MKIFWCIVILASNRVAISAPNGGHHHHNHDHDHDHEHDHHHDHDHAADCAKEAPAALEDIIEELGIQVLGKDQESANDVSPVEDHSQLNIQALIDELFSISTKPPPTTTTQRPQTSTAKLPIKSHWEGWVESPVDLVMHNQVLEPVYDQEFKGTTPKPDYITETQYYLQQQQNEDVFGPLPLPLIRDGKGFDLDNSLTVNQLIDKPIMPVLDTRWANFHLVNTQASINKNKNRNNKSNHHHKNNSDRSERNGSRKSVVANFNQNSDNIHNNLNNNNNNHVDSDPNNKQFVGNEERRLNNNDNSFSLSDRQPPLVQGEERLTDNRGQFIDNRGQLTDNRGQLTDNRSRLTDNRGQLTDNRSGLTDNRGRLTELSSHDLTHLRAPHASNFQGPNFRSSPRQSRRFDDLNLDKIIDQVYNNNINSLNNNFNNNNNNINSLNNNFNNNNNIVNNNLLSNRDHNGFAAGGDIRGPAGDFNPAKNNVGNRNLPNKNTSGTKKGFRAAAPREELVTPPPPQQQQQQHRPSPSKSTTTTTTRNRASEALKKGRSGALSQRAGKGAKEEVRQFDVFGRSKTRIAGTIRFKNIHKKNPSQRKAKSRPISAGLTTVGRASSASKFSADGSSAGILAVRSSTGRSSADKSSTGSSSAERLSAGKSAGKSGRLQPQISLVPNLASSATFESSLRQTASSKSFQHQQAESFGASSQILNPNTFPNLSKSFEAPGTKSSKSSTKPQSGLISKRKGAATTSSKLSRNQIPSGFGPSEIRSMGELHCDRPGLFTDRTSGCKSFVMCHENGRMGFFRCPAGTLFNQAHQICDWARNVEC